MASHYTREESSGTVRFHVVPMAYPMPGRANLVFWLGVLVIALGILTLIVLVGFLFIPFGIWAIYQSRKLKARYACENEKRQPLDITLDAHAVATSGGENYAIADIAEFTTGNSERLYQGSTYVRSAGQAFQQVNAERIAQTLHDASWQVCLRLRSDSRLWELAAGLDRQTADALASDLSMEVRKRREVA